MTIPRITTVPLGGSPELPLLVVGPSLGTSSTALWATCADALADHVEIFGWDLPGHGANTGLAEPFTMTELAAGVGRAIDELDRPDAPFACAGVSVGGAVGLELVLARPERVTSTVVMCTGAKIGEPAGWAARAELVRRSGTAAVADASVERWFGPGFVDRRPGVVATLLEALRVTEPEGYAQVCDALAAYDVRSRLGTIRTPVLAIAGSADVATPVADLAAIVDGVADGRLVVLDGVGHLAPAERPVDVARLIVAHLGATSATAVVAARREVDR